jgi:hypothetical protein
MICTRQYRGGAVPANSNGTAQPAQASPGAPPGPQRCGVRLREWRKPRCDLVQRARRKARKVCITTNRSGPSQNNALWPAVHASPPKLCRGDTDRPTPQSSLGGPNSHSPAVSRWAGWRLDEAAGQGPAAGAPREQRPVHSLSAERTSICGEGMTEFRAGCSRGRHLSCRSTRATIVRRSVVIATPRTTAVR